MTCRPASSVVPEGLDAVVDEPLLVGGDPEPFAERGVQGLGDVLGHRDADHGQQGERGHRQTHGFQCVVGHLGGGAFVERGRDLAHQPQQHAVHHEGGGVLDQHGGFLERLAQHERGGEDCVAGLRGAHDFQQRHDGHGVEEVEADHAFGMQQVRGHLGDGERGGVGGQDAVLGDHCLHFGEDLLLDGQFLEHRLDHEVGVREGFLGGRTGDQGLGAVGRIGGDALFGQQLVHFGMDVAHALVHPRLVDVGS